MIFYGLSAQKVRGVLRRPDRREAGVAKNTIAVMQRAKTKRPMEFWVMFQKKSSLKARAPLTRKVKVAGDKRILGRTVVISVWRYPGVSRAGKDIPMPEDIRKELENLNN